MRILVIGATGTLGRPVVEALGAHEILAAGRHGPVVVDLAEPDSIHALYRGLGEVDAVVCAAGEAGFAPLDQLTDADFERSLRSKLMGQVNLVRFGFASVRDGGSFTLTSGVLARRPMRGSAAVSLVNSALEGFARAAALEAPRSIRVNVVSPPWATESLRALGMDLAGGRPAAAIAQVYRRSVEGRDTGQVLEL